MKRRLSALLCALGLLLALSACDLPGREGETPPPGAYALYFALSSAAETDGGEAAVDCEYLSPAGGDFPDRETAVAALLAALLERGPETPGLVSPFPAGTALRQWEFERGGGLRVDMNESYGALSGIGLTVANYCLTLTLCQLEEVEYVHVTVMGEELPFWQTDAMRESDVILSGAEEESVTVTAALYYPRAQGEGLGVEYRDVVVAEGDILAGAVMAAYVKGPTYRSLRSPLPEGTVLLSVSLEGGVCYVNFSAAVMGAAREEETAREFIDSLVNTVGSLEKVDAIRLRVDGETLTEFGGIPVAGLKPEVH